MHLHKLTDKKNETIPIKKKTFGSISPIGRLPKISKPINTQHICHKLIDFIQFLLTILHNSISSKTIIFYVIIFLIINLQEIILNLQKLKIIIKINPTHLIEIKQQN